MSQASFLSSITKFLHHVWRYSLDFAFLGGSRHLCLPAFATIAILQNSADIYESIPIQVIVTTSSCLRSCSRRFLELTTSVSQVIDSLGNMGFGVDVQVKHGVVVLRLSVCIRSGKFPAGSARSGTSEYFFGVFSFRRPPLDFLVETRLQVVNRIGALFSNLWKTRLFPWYNLTVFTIVVVGMWPTRSLDLASCSIPSIVWSNSPRLYPRNCKCVAGCK